MSAYRVDKDRPSLSWDSMDFTKVFLKTKTVRIQKRKI